MVPTPLQLEQEVDSYMRAFSLKASTLASSKCIATASDETLGGPKGLRRIHDLTDFHVI